MAKMTVYVPDGLKKRMDEVEGINWSPLACRAFESKLAEIISEKGAKDMSDVAARLRESRRKGDTKIAQRGREDGRRWASDRAETAELERLEAAFEVCSQNHIEAFGDSEDGAYGPGESFLFTIRPDDQGDRIAAKDFWVSYDDGEEIMWNSAYVRAFAEGALEVWDDVKDQI